MHPSLAVLLERFPAQFLKQLPPWLAPRPRTCRGPGASRLPARVTVGVLLVRLVILPALLTLLLVAALALRLLRSPNPLFLVTLLLSNATPTAINMQVGCDPPPPLSPVLSGEAGLHVHGRDSAL